MYYVRPCCIEGRGRKGVRITSEIFLQLVQAGVVQLQTPSVAKEAAWESLLPKQAVGIYLMTCEDLERTQERECTCFDAKVCVCVISMRRGGVATVWILGSSLYSWIASTRAEKGPGDMTEAVPCSRDTCQIGRAHV